jgi:hypothetical protein
VVGEMREPTRELVLEQMAALDAHRADDLAPTPAG